MITDILLVCVCVVLAYSLRVRKCKTHTFTCVRAHVGMFVFEMCAFARCALAARMINCDTSIERIVLSARSSGLRALNAHYLLIVKKYCATEWDTPVRNERAQFARL